MDKEIMVLRSAQAKSAEELTDDFVGRCVSATGLPTDKVREIITQVRDAKTYKPTPRKRTQIKAYDALLTEGQDTYHTPDESDIVERSHPTDY